MNFADDFRNEELVKKLISHIRKIAIKPVRIMEVCGGHTMAIRRYGIPALLPETIDLLSGPGCPVCVTDQSYIDKTVAYSQNPDTILVTYGDLLRVPGSFSTLDQEKAKGADVRIVYSTLEALEIARQNPTKKIVFAAIGFETTVPATAIAVLQADKENIDNFLIVCAHKTMPQAMGALIEEGIPIDGYIGPGHVSAIAGSKIFMPIAQKYNIPVVISGFEPVDILQSILMLAENIINGKGGVEIQYRRLVTEQGNLKAQTIVENVFEPDTQIWRGIGPIRDSGLRLREKYSRYDAEKQIPVNVISGPEPKGCICGSVLKGIKKPVDCPLFGKKCTPTHPVGACMVSSEGACQAYYQYKSDLVL
jgi:hydrogenase expression/formation protein HypD